MAAQVFRQMDPPRTKRTPNLRSLSELLPVLKTPRLGVFIEPEVGHGKTDVYEGIQG
jgi:hypothetical protein